MTKANGRLLANTVAHQWWGSQVSPATLNDTWITNGMCRYGELMDVEDEGGQTALEHSIVDISASALAYDTIPLSGIGRDDPFSPEFQSMTFDKGAMVFHAALGGRRGQFPQYLESSAHTVRGQANSYSGFHQGCGIHFAAAAYRFLRAVDRRYRAPAFNNKYTVYRLGNNKGFRTIGEIGQDLDLFSMPVELRIETDGKTEIKRIDVVGTTLNMSLTPSVARAIFRSTPTTGF